MGQWVCCSVSTQGGMDTVCSVLVGGVVLLIFMCPLMRETSRAVLSALVLTSTKLAAVSVTRHSSLAPHKTPPPAVISMARAIFHSLSILPRRLSQWTSISSGSTAVAWF